MTVPAAVPAPDDREVEAALDLLGTRIARGDLGAFAEFLALRGATVTSLTVVG